MWVVEGIIPLISALYRGCSSDRMVASGQIYGSISRRTAFLMDALLFTRFPYFSTER